MSEISLGAILIACVAAGRDCIAGSVTLEGSTLTLAGVATLAGGSATVDESCAFKKVLKMQRLIKMIKKRLHEIWLIVINGLL